MSGKNPSGSDAMRVELAVGECEALSLLPSTAARFLNQLSSMELTPGSLAELIESDPALTILVLRLCHNKGINISQSSRWIQQVLEGISLREIRGAVLSAGIYGGLTEGPREIFRRELTRHCVAVACCGEQLSQLAGGNLDGASVYLAGLLHDTGKFLLDEVMPKSFDILVEQARKGKTSSCKSEQENLGLDHTIIGKRFAQKLHLPSDIILGIWLHHSQTGAISESMPQARIAAAVELADSMVRRAGIGESGSYDEQDISEELAITLGLNTEQINRVEKQLAEMVKRKFEIAGLTLLKPGLAYCHALQAMVGKLAEESSILSDQSSKLQSGADNFDFIKEFLPKINSSMTSIELAESFAVTWQRFYKTGPVCIYLVGEGKTSAVEAVIVENQAKVKTVILDVAEDTSLVPQQFNEQFAVLDAADYTDWLLEQVEPEFDLTHTKMAPLKAGGRTAAVIVFELRYAFESKISEKFEACARFGGATLDILRTIESQQWYAERFAQLLKKPVPTEEHPVQPAQGEQEALAEMAAGAAHELNNPLSVISGRAQLLAGSETDAEKKRILEQIQQNARELSAIIDDLMSYARPERPRATTTPVRQIIDEAADLTRQKKNTDKLDIKVEIDGDMPNISADSAQIASAISNIFCNSLESYPTGTGPITIKATAAEGKKSVSIEVIDTGCGMDEGTLNKARQPFFSAKPAGRKRGMGLAHAERAIEMNGGKLKITSEPNKGTAVTVTLPSKV